MKYPMHFPVEKTHVAGVVRGHLEDPFLFGDRIAVVVRQGSHIEVTVEVNRLNQANDDLRHASGEHTPAVRTRAAR
jgi:hypothetical protein